MEYSLNDIQNLLHENSKLLPEKKVAAGFDGFVDSVIRVIKTKPGGHQPKYFEEIREFGDYIIRREGSSFSLETDQIFQKLGGNMPILSNAIAQFGVTVNCIGAFGDPAIHPVFNSMHEGCRLYSFTSPGITSALEFADGKILLGEMKELNLADWSLIRKKVGIERLLEIYRESDLWCYVNWGELDGSSDIWNGILSDVMPKVETAKINKKAFFDLSDCSKRSREAMKDALHLIERFAVFCDVTLSLNKNEARQVYTSLITLEPPDDLEILGRDIFEKLNIKNLIIHTSKYACAWNNVTAYKSQGYSIKAPKIITGAGDNFNAGICVGLLLELDLDYCLSLGNAIAACYISKGQSPTSGELQLNSLQQ